MQTEVRQSVPHLSQKQLLHDFKKNKSLGQDFGPNLVKKGTFGSLLKIAVHVYSTCL